MPSKQIQPPAILCGTQGSACSIPQHSTGSGMCVIMWPIGLHDFALAVMVTHRDVTLFSVLQLMELPLVCHASCIMRRQAPGMGCGHALLQLWLAGRHAATRTPHSSHHTAWVAAAPLRHCEQVSTTSACCKVPCMSATCTKKCSRVF